MTVPANNDAAQELAPHERDRVRALGIRNALTLAIDGNLKPDFAHDARNYLDELVARLATAEAALLAAEQTIERREVDYFGLEDRLERAEQTNTRLRQLLREQLAWESRMPDAGFTSEDPRWQWWHERPRPDLDGTLE